MRSPHLTDEHVTTAVRAALTYGSPWGLLGPQRESLLGISKMVCDELALDWFGAPVPWVRPACALALEPLVQSGWAGCEIQLRDRSLHGDTYHRIAPLSLTEWARVAESCPTLFPWHRAVLRQLEPGPFYEPCPVAWDRNPLPDLARSYLLLHGPTPVPAFLAAITSLSAGICGGDPTTLSILAPAIGRGLLRSGWGAMRTLPSTAFVLPPMRPSRSYHGPSLAIGPSSLSPAPREQAHVSTALPYLPLPPRFPRQLSLPL